GRDPDRSHAAPTPVNRGARTRDRAGRARRAADQEGDLRSRAFVARRMRSWAATLALAACSGGAKQGSWIERDTHAVPHATSTGAPPAPAGVRVDVSKLDALTIDELDDATARGVLDQLGDRKPAARVALRAARLAHHRGDDADARALVARAASAA